jgi:hypothetical protein
MIIVIIITIITIIDQPSSQPSTQPSSQPSFNSSQGLLPKLPSSQPTSQPSMPPQPIGNYSIFTLEGRVIFPSGLVPDDVLVKGIIIDIFYYLCLSGWSIWKYLV